MALDINNNNKIYSRLLDAVLITLFVIPGIAWLSNTGDIASYFLYTNLDGQFIYVLSKLVGLYAMMFIWLQILLGLLKPQIKRYYGDLTPKSHRWLGIISLILVILHVGLFVAAVSLRNDHFAWKLFVPNFFQGYYALMLTIGLFALITLLASVISRGVLAKANNAIKLWVHRLVLVAFFMILIHSYTIGTESQLGMMSMIYLLMFGSITGILIFRIYQWFRLYIINQQLSIE